MHYNYHVQGESKDMLIARGLTAMGVYDNHDAVLR